MTSIAADTGGFQFNAGMNTARATLLLALSLCASSALVRAQDVYKYVDAQGHVIFSDAPPGAYEGSTAPDPQADDPSHAESGAPQFTSTETPPALQDEEQPPLAVAGNLWIPGYWAWGPTGYYWVPGQWVAPPRVGVLWTPGYWAYDGSEYVFYSGYWGPHVGYYGGVNYGHGYFGSGYSGGRWVGRTFNYNAAVSHLDARLIRNVYREQVRADVGHGRASFTAASHMQEHAGPAVSRMTLARSPEHSASEPSRYAPIARPQQGTMSRQMAAPEPRSAMRSPPSSSYERAERAEPVRREPSSAYRPPTTHSSPSTRESTPRPHISGIEPTR